MAWNSRTIGLVGTILLPVLAAAGCTGTDVITAGNATVRFAITAVNNNTRFENILMQLNQVGLRPLDPAGDVALGSRNVALITTSLTVNLTGTPPDSPDVPLPSGLYVIERLDIQSVRAVDTDGTGSDASCAEYVSSYPATGVISYLNGADINAVVAVEANRDNVISLTIDIGQFIAALQDAWFCSQSCPGGAPWCTVPGGFFLSSIFKSSADNYFSFD